MSDTLRTAVLNYLRRSGGATDDEGARATGIQPNTYRPRRLELEEMGLVVDTGERKPTGRGRSAAVYAATDQTMAVDDIDIGERIRISVGDLSSLKCSIRDVGLLQPIVVTSDGRLVSGERRLRACEELGWTEVPVRVAHWLDGAAKLLQAEENENTCRLDMTVEERARFARRMAAVEAPKARERQGTRTDLQPSGNLPEGSRGETREIVGKAVGMSGRTYERAKAVVEAADEGDPVAVVALEEMNRTGKVMPAYKKVREANMTDRQRSLVDAARARWDVAIAQIGDFENILERASLESVIDDATEQDIEKWSDTLRRAEKALRKVRHQMLNRTEDA